MYDAIPRAVEMMTTPTQSMAVRNRLHVKTSRGLSLGSFHMLAQKRMKMIAAVRWKPNRHVSGLSATKPPMTRPIIKPTGWPTPRHPKAKFRPRPGGIVLVRMLNAVGRQREAAMPWIARNTMIWIPVWESPAARVEKEEEETTDQVDDAIPVEVGDSPG